MLREICLDIETTGLDPREGHKIVEIACFELLDKVKTGKFFHSFVNPRRDMPEEAFRIHGISSEFLKDKPIFDLIVDKFLNFIGDDIIIIHNAPFDTKFLNYELNLVQKKPLNMSKVVDSLVLARKKFPGSPNSLDALCKRFQLDLSKRQKHGALIDTELLCDVYIELMGGAQGGFGFDNDNIAKKEQPKSQDNFLQKKIVKKDKPIIDARDYSPSIQELEAHQEFIKKNFKEN
ncbi:MAG: DNA polymerase III subunit epsilon, partial [Alphaproteobacteria bacterium]